MCPAAEAALVGPCVAYAESSLAEESAVFRAQLKVAEAERWPTFDLAELAQWLERGFTDRKMSFLLFARRLSFYLPKRTKRRITWRAYALLVLPATCYGLGYWQVQRRRWKLDLLDQLDRTIAATPVPLPSTTSILVNRGWVPEYNRDPVSRKQGQPSIFAIKPPLLQCENTEHQVPHIQFSCRHIDKMARTFGTLPLLIDANYESTVADGPIGGQTRVQLRNEHASYILTWVSLGVVGTALWINYFLL
ncbi:surfeit locus 1 family protein [Clonorchis sinensis]|uniref:SURF1-like protein n=1 Tax=Clonorchis sinensis TaxID=79923 RepID=G7YBQ8_CLOSI|nr:surfeit locus 1 family protein [Clonorchis sinensis]